MSTTCWVRTPLPAPHTAIRRRFASSSLAAYSRQCRASDRGSWRESEGLPVRAKVRLLPRGRRARPSPKRQAAVKAGTRRVTPWLERGEFDHRAHRAVGCESCHAAARASTKTADVLIPKMESCLPVTAKARAGLDRCGVCHLYHNRALEEGRRAQDSEGRGDSNGQVAWWGATDAGRSRENNEDAWRGGGRARTPRSWRTAWAGRTAARSGRR